MKSYDDKYLDNVATNLGTIFEYAVSYGYAPNVFWNIFASSEVAKQIEKGNPRFLVGYSAIDLLDKVVNGDVPNGNLFTPAPLFGRSRFYWAGWALAQYQNYKTVSFFDINKAFPIERVLQLYDTLHEADITKFFDVANDYIEKSRKDTNLKRIRTAAGLSQKQLSEISEVSIRNIQMYEQRHNDINKAQADILYRLSKALGCTMEDLFEE